MIFLVEKLTRQEKLINAVCTSLVRKNLLMKYEKIEYGKYYSLLIETVSEKFNQPVLYRFDQKSAKYTCFRYKDEKRVNEVKAEILAHFKRRVEDDIETKAKRANRVDEVKERIEIGKTILYSSWGYEQTNLFYYLVVALKGNTVELKSIGRNTVKGSEGQDSEQCTPNPEMIGEKIYKTRIGSTGDMKSPDYEGTSLNFLTKGSTQHRSWGY